VRLFAAILFLSETLLCSASEPPSRFCTVTEVYDGDTLTASCYGAERRIRLSSVDAPERKQSYGEASQEMTESLTLHRTVTVDIQDYDRYGRIVARIVLEDGRDLARELVRAGLAWHYVKYSRDPVLGALEAEARQRRVGLWWDAFPEPPSAYRAAQREKTDASRSQRSVRRTLARSERRTLLARR
jgi:endonuclease YncB( thermonuclease family)